MTIQIINKDNGTAIKIASSDGLPSHFRGWLHPDTGRVSNGYGQTVGTATQTEDGWAVKAS